MDTKTIIEIIAGILGVTGITLAITTHVNKSRRKDTNKIRDIKQQAISSDKVYQSGRDINVK